MPLRSGLALYCYQLNPTNTTNPAFEYSAVAESLNFTTLAPGGCGSLEAMIKLTDARLPRPELGIFSRVALMDPSMGNAADPPGMGVWIGEMSDPEYGFTLTDGEYIKLEALGIGATLRDDPRVENYTNKTPLQIVTSEMSSRSSYLVIDPDTSALFPDAPTNSLSPAYQGRNMEDVVSDVTGMVGDYHWGTWPHPRNRDAAGFPTGQLQIHLRQTASAAYIASITAGDVIGWRVVPSQERCYNVVGIGYNDPNIQPNPVGVKTYTDPRLGAGGTQGSAPFRRRAFYRDLSGVVTATAAQAQAIANQYGAEYQNISYTTELTLAGCRDAAGNPIALWQVWADRCIFVPELAVRGQQLVTVPTAGVNLFYIRQTRYSEDQSGNMQIVLTCDNWADIAAIALARLQLQADAVQRLGQTTTGTVQAMGAPVQGQAGGTQNASGSGQVIGFATTYPTGTLAQSPTSINTVSVKESTNVSGGSRGAADITTAGFLLFWTSAAAGKSTYTEVYITQGNCLVAVDEAAGTWAHHCAGCERALRRTHGCVPTAHCPDCREAATHRGGRIATQAHPEIADARHYRDEHRELVVHLHPESGPDADGAPGQPGQAGQSGQPGQTAISITCQHCGQSEALNTALAAGDEETGTVRNSPWRAEQARLIRALMRAHGLRTA